MHMALAMVPAAVTEEYVEMGEQIGEAVQPPLDALVGSFRRPLWSPGLRQNSALLPCKHIEPQCSLLCGFVGCIWGRIRSC